MVKIIVISSVLANEAEDVWLANQNKHFKSDRYSSQTNYAQKFHEV